MHTAMLLGVSCIVGALGSKFKDSRSDDELTALEYTEKELQKARYQLQKARYGLNPEAYKVVDKQKLKDRIESLKSQKRLLLRVSEGIKDNVDIGVRERRREQHVHHLHWSEWTQADMNEHQIYKLHKKGQVDVLRMPTVKGQEVFWLNYNRRKT